MTAPADPPVPAALDALLRELPRYGIHTREIYWPDGDKQCDIKRDLRVASPAR
jgi:hypothetical protein